jgi:hypothetical protein
MNSMLGETPCRRATAETVMPGCIVASTGARFCSAPTPPAPAVGDDFDGPVVVRHRRTPRRNARPAQSCATVGSKGGRSRMHAKTDPKDVPETPARSARRELPADKSTSRPVAL